MGKLAPILEARKRALAEKNRPDPGIHITQTMQEAAARVEQSITSCVDNASEAIAEHIDDLGKDIQRAVVANNLLIDQVSNDIRKKQPDVDGFVRRIETIVSQKDNSLQIEEIRSMVEQMLAGKKQVWTFNVQRDHNGLITSISAE